MSNQPQTPTPTPNPEKGSSSKPKAKEGKAKELEEVIQITPEMLRKAALVLYNGYALMDEPDMTIDDSDLMLDVTITLRIGKNHPVIVEEHRRMQAMLANPDVASAPEEFEIALRQILLPLYKEVQRATNASMAADQSPGVALLGFNAHGPTY